MSIVSNILFLAIIILGILMMSTESMKKNTMTNTKLKSTKMKTNNQMLQKSDDGKNALSFKYQLLTMIPKNLLYL